jgi:hypothetical protein
MSWLVDNANALYVLLIIVAAGLVVAWRFNQRVKFLALAVIPLLLIGVLFLLTCLVISDSKQLEMNVNAMADAVRDGEVDDLFKHISNDFSYQYQNQKMTRDQLYEAARQVIQRGRVGNIRITQFKVEEVSRANKTANVKFKVTPFDGNGDVMPPFVTQARFVLEGEQWKLKTVDFYKSFVDTDQKIGIPGL